jgi:serpin B
MEIRRSCPCPVTAEEGGVVRSSVRKFGSRLYCELAERERGNFVFSPYSVSNALALARLGAAGSTLESISEVMGCGDLAPVRGLLALSRLGLEAGEGKLSMVNDAWMQAGCGFLPSFVDDLVETACACHLVDFMKAPEECRKKINERVAEGTKGRIANLLPPGSITSMMRLVLTNAIHFKDQWREPFDKDGTVSDIFRGAGGSRNIMMMNGRNIEGRHCAGAGFEAVVLSYGAGAGMLIVLPDDSPNPDMAFQDLEKRLDADGVFLASILGAARKAKIHMEFPKFGTESGFFLKSALGALGLEEMFLDGAADFSDMTGGRDFVVEEAVHKATIDVNECDTEASAATGMIMRAVVSFVPRVSMRVDRPFLFAIVAGDAPLFMGRIMDL